MRSSAKKLGSLSFVVASLLIVTGCVTAPKTLYNWEGYQAQVYQSLKGDESVIADQINKLEIVMRKVQGTNELLPPGFRAQLGLLYSKNGQVELAQQQWNEEKRVFPESTVFMDFLINKTKIKAKG